MHGHHQSLRKCQADAAELRYDRDGLCRGGSCPQPLPATSSGCDPTVFRPSGLPDHLRQILLRDEDLKVEIMHRGAERRKFRVIGISRLGANQLTFLISTRVRKCQWRTTSKRSTKGCDTRIYLACTLGAPNGTFTCRWRCARWSLSALRSSLTP